MASTLSVDRHRTLYRALLLLYPRGFRRAYGESMAQVFADCVRAHGPRVWLRTVPDLVRTVPTERIEAVMARVGHGVRPVALVFVVFAAVVVAVGAGRGAFLVALLALIVALASQRSVLMSLTSGERAPLRHAVVQAWWAPVAGFLGAAMFLFGVGTIFEATNWGGRVFGSAVLMAFGTAMLLGLKRRPFDRHAGNSLILLATIPPILFFWAIVPPVLAIVVWVGVLSSGYSDKTVAAA